VTVKGINNSFFLKAGLCLLIILLIAFSKSSHSQTVMSELKDIEILSFQDSEKAAS